MSNENRCPFCMSVSVETIANEDLLAGHGYRGKCMTCGATGPQVGAPFWAVENFTHPAHLHTYDPETEVKIKRETGEYCFYTLEAAGLKYGGSPVGLAAMADLTTALEVK